MFGTKYQTFFLVCTLFFCSVVFPELAFAGYKHSDIGKTICTASSWFNGNLGKGLAMMGLFTVGAGALYGKITWAQAVLVGVGIAVLFGADALVLSLSGINCQGNFT